MGVFLDHRVSTDKHRKTPFVKCEVASFVFLLCVRHVRIQRPLGINSGIIPSLQYIP